MLKVAAINQLYGTNLYAVNRMAAHITAALHPKVPRPGPALVERIACIPPLDGQRSWRHFSFASKFCHFFVDQEACPIFDSYADDTLRLHLGRNRERDSEHPYVAFVNNVTVLRRLAGVTATAVEMDRYLWIRGAFEQWRETPERPLNTELEEFFGKHARTPQLAALLGK